MHALLDGLVFVVKHRLDLGESFHKGRYLVSEKTSKVVHGVVCVFHDIVQKGSDDGLVSKSDVANNNFSNRYRVKYIWLPRASSDALVSFVGEIKSLLDHVQFRLIGASLACRLLQVGIFSCYDLIVMLIELRYLSHTC